MYKLHPEPGVDDGVPVCNSAPQISGAYWPLSLRWVHQPQCEDQRDLQSPELQDPRTFRIQNATAGINQRCVEQHVSEEPTFARVHDEAVDELSDCWTPPLHLLLTSRLLPCIGYVPGQFLANVVRLGVWF